MYLFKKIYFMVLSDRGRETERPLEILNKIDGLCYDDNDKLSLMETNDNNNKKNKPLTIRGIPLVAIVFPPLGLLMLLKYLLNKNKKEDKWKD